MCSPGLLSLARFSCACFFFPMNELIHKVTTAYALVGVVFSARWVVSALRWVWFWAHIVIMAVCLWSLLLWVGKGAIAVLVVRCIYGYQGGFVC